MPEVFSSAETSLELVDPITDAVIMAIPFLRDDSFSESPTYGPRGYHRSAAVSAARLRSKGTITIRKDVEGMAFAREVERWQKGVIWYPMGSDLKGKRFRHPHIRKVMTQPDGTREYRTAYDVRLSDRTLSRPDAGLVSESFTFEVQGGFDSPGSDRGEPVRALDFHRTGSATYVGLDGQLRTAGDGVARIGLPWVKRRNLLRQSENLLDMTVWDAGQQHSAKLIGEYDHSNLYLLTRGSGESWRCYPQSVGLLTAGRSYTLSAVFSPDTSEVARLVLDGSWAGFFVGVDVVLSSGVANWGGSVGAASISAGRTELGGGFYRVWVTFTPIVTVGPSGGPACGAAGKTIKACKPQIEDGAITPYQPTNATGLDHAHPLNGAGLVLEGAGKNLYDQADVAYSGASGLNFLTGFDSSWISGNTTYTLSFNVESAATYAVFKVDAFNSASEYIGTPIAIDLVREGKRTVVTWISSASIYYCNVYIDFGTGGSAVLTDFQLEASPFPTSYMGPGGARQPDLVGIVHPHNLLLHSEDFLNPAWATIGNIYSQLAVPGPKGGMRGTRFNLGTYSGKRQVLSTKNYAGKAVTLAVWGRRVSGTGTAGLQAFDGAMGNGVNYVIGLDAEWRRYSVPLALPAHAASGVVMHVMSWDSTGDFEFSGASLVEGHHPGVYVPTTDTPIPAPASPALDPALSQNGVLEFDAILPSVNGSPPTGKDLVFFGSSTAYLSRWGGKAAADTSIAVVRHHNGSAGYAGIPGLGQMEPFVQVWDGVKHRFRFEWTNEINEQTGVREMWQRLYIDGVLVAQQDVAALYGATAWAPIDPSRLISDGNVNAVISGPSSNPGGVIIEFPRPRAGYRQADRAA